jgi:hypothetical protein
VPILIVRFAVYAVVTGGMQGLVEMQGELLAEVEAKKRTESEEAEEKPEWSWSKAAGEEKESGKRPPAEDAEETQPADVQRAVDVVERVSTVPPNATEINIVVRIRLAGGVKEEDGKQRRKSCESDCERFARGDRKWPMNEGQIPNVRGVRVALGTGYDRGEGHRWASRNGRVSLSPTRNPYGYDSQTCASLYGRRRR